MWVFHQLGDRGAGKELYLGGVWGGDSGGAGGAKKGENGGSIFEPYRGDTKFSPIYLIISVPRRLKIHRKYGIFHRILGYTIN